MLKNSRFGRVLKEFVTDLGSTPSRPADGGFIVSEVRGLF